jgi:hypothetical protein
MSDKTKKRIKEKIDRFAHWLVFSVFIALLPIFFNFIRFKINAESVTLNTLFGRGEILLIAVAISGRGLGELVPTGTSWLTAKRLVIGINLIIIATASFGFAHISFAHVSSSKVPINLAFASWFSIITFFFAVFGSGFCILLKED